MFKQLLGFAIVCVLIVTLLSQFGIAKDLFHAAAPSRCMPFKNMGAGCKDRACVSFTEAMFDQMAAAAGVDNYHGDESYADIAWTYQICSPFDPRDDWQAGYVCEMDPELEQTCAQRRWHDGWDCEGAILYWENLTTAECVETNPNPL